MNIKMLDLKHMGRLRLQSEPNRINGVLYASIISVLQMHKPDWLTPYLGL